MDTRTITSLLTTAMVGAFLALPAVAQENPYTQPDASWISIDGTVESVDTDAFTLDYGDGFVTVEMDDGDRDADGYKLMEGDKVTVTGRVDDDFLEVATIEASSVFVENLGTYFYASAVDEEDTFVTTDLVIVGDAVLQGVVTEVRDEEFVLDTGPRRITVEVEEMAYDPLDDEGYQQVDVGDRVSITGHMDTDFFEGTEFVAETLVILG